jgi:hypothetical protein
MNRLVEYLIENYPPPYEGYKFVNVKKVVKDTDFTRLEIMKMIKELEKDEIVYFITGNRTPENLQERADRLANIALSWECYQKYKNEVN